MSVYDEKRQLLDLIEKTRIEQKKLSLLVEQVKKQKLIFKITKVLWEIMVEAQTERERELLRLVRGSEYPSVAIKVALDAVAAYVGSEVGKGK